MLAATAAGCLREGTDGCPACMYLVFTHKGTTQGFDSEIGNDVRLQIYYDGVWHSSRTIPYSAIAGGRKYYFKKSTSQQVGLVAYAVPPGAGENIVPGASEGLRFTDQKVAMPSYTRTLPQCAPYTEDLYAGVVSVIEPWDQETEHVVQMNNVFCGVTVIIKNAYLFRQHFPGVDPSLGLLGTARSATTHNGATDGEEVEIRSAFTYDQGSDRYTTAKMRVLPSPDGQKTLSVNIYEAPGQQTLPAFDSGELSVAAREVVITYDMGENSVTITLTVDGWDIRSETVPLK